MNNADVIKRFVKNGNKSATGSNLYYRDNRLINYSTAIAQWLSDGLVIVNRSHYSSTTTNHQSALLSELHKAGIKTIELDGLGFGVYSLEKYIDTNPYIPYEIKLQQRHEQWRKEQKAKMKLEIKEAYKDKQFLVFIFSDGTYVKYNLTTNELINKNNKAVKSLATYFRGQILSDVINMFADNNTRNFLQHIYEQTRWSKIIDNNISTYLHKIGEYSNLERYFAAGITKIDTKIKYPLSDVPKGLIELSRIKNITISNRAVEQYRLLGDKLQNIINMDFMALNPDNLLPMLLNTNSPYFNKLIYEYNYHYKSLAEYLDYIISNENIGLHDLLRELADYANMMSTLSTRYDKYPKKFAEAHKIAVANYNAFKQEHNEELFAKRYNPKLEADFRNYVVISPKTIQDIKDEGARQHHCVASYVNRIIDGHTYILFLRKKNELDQSLVTLEVQDGEVVQAKGRYNRSLTEDEQRVLTQYKRKLAKERVA